MREKLRIYLDNCCFNRPYDDQSNLKVEIETKAKLFIQQQIATGNIELVWLYILEYENGKNPYIEKKSAIAAWRPLSVMYVDESEQLILLAEKIADTGVKTSDSLHVAAAIMADCDYFITTDRRIIKHQSERIKITDPTTFIHEWSDEK
jgi:predicted nucleic-acid-binding protein